MPGTTLTGRYVNSGRGQPVTLLFELGSNIWIVGLIDGTTKPYLKMVKIRLTGATTSEWLDTRYNSLFPLSCGRAATFNVGCFTGTAAGEAMYPVSLKASAGRGFPSNTHVLLCAWCCRDCAEGWHLAQPWSS